LVFDECKKFLVKQGMPEVTATLIGGGIAGAASVFANTPIDVIKTNM